MNAMMMMDTWMYNVCAAEWVNGQKHFYSPAKVYVNVKKTLVLVLLQSAEPLVKKNAGGGGSER